MEPFLKFLFQQKVLTEQQTKACLFLQKTQKTALTDILIQRNFLTSEQISYWQTQFLQQKNPPLSPKTTTLIPQNKTEPSSSLLEELHLFSQKSKTNQASLSERTTLKLEAFPEKEISKTSENTTHTQQNDIFASLEGFSQEKKQTAKNLTISATTKMQAISESIENDPIQARDEFSNEDRYDLLETLGQGGMGIVQRVKDKMLRREVALKRIKSSQSNTLSNIQKIMLWRLRREAEITAILEHPNIVPLYDMQRQSNGELYFTMRKVQGETLQNLLKKIRSGKRPYEEQQILSIFLKVCDAIAYAHSEKIIHRDLKPENIMVGAFGEVYVMDWGIAKILGERESQEIQEIQEAIEEKVDTEFVQQGEYKTVGGMGTPGYMPPEQQENASEVKPQSDIYALGKMLRQCFTLLSPMEEFHLRVEADRKKRQTQKSSELQELEEKVPEEIQAIVQKATEERLQQRYFSVQAFSNDIQQYLAHERVSAKTYRFSEIVFKWIQRNKQKVLFGSTILALCIFFPLYSQWNEHKKRQKSFTEASFIAKKNYEKMLNIKGSSRDEQRQKITLLLDTLNELNNAIYLYPERIDSKQMKAEIGKKLIQICYETEDYQLANYVAKNLQSLTLLDAEEKKNILEEVLQTQNKKLNEHLETLDIWKKKLQDRILGFEAEDAIFEISKMQEPEVVERLLNIIQESENYFKQKKRNATKDEFYRIMVIALGRMNNPKAGLALMDLLENLSEHFLQNPENKYDNTQLQFFIAMTNAIVFSKPPDVIDRLYDIRKKFVKKGFQNFQNNTTLSYVKLASLDKDSFDWKKNPKRYFQKIKEEFDHIAQNNSFEKIELYSLNEEDTKKIVELEEELLKILQVDPENPEVHEYLSFVYFSKKEIEKSLSFIENALAKDPKRSDLLVHLLTIKYYQEDFSSAVFLLKEKIETEPDNLVFYYELGKVYLKQNEYAKAKDILMKSIRINPQFEDPYPLLIDLMIRQEDFLQALQTSSTALRISPGNYKVLYSRAQIYQQENLLKEALEDITLAIKLYPQSSKNYVLRASIRNKIGDIEGAIQDCNQANFLSPKEQENYIIKGNIYFDQKKYLEAIENYTDAIHNNSLFPQAYHNRALAYYELNKKDIAFQDINEAIEQYKQKLEFISKEDQSDPFKKADKTFSEYAKAYTKRGQWKIEKQQIDSALLDLHKAIEINPKELEAYQNLGYASYLKQNFGEAIEFYTKAIKLNATDPISYNNRANSYLALKQFENATSDYTEAIRLDPNYVKPYHGRGTLYYRTKNFSKALEDYNSAILLDPKVPMAYLSRSAIKMDMKNFEDAILDATEALKIDPSFLMAYYQRGQAKILKGNPSGAKEDFAQFLQLSNGQNNPQYAQIRQFILQKFPELETPR